MAIATKLILMMYRNYGYRGILPYYLIIFIFIYQLFTVLPDFTFFIIRRTNSFVLFWWNIISDTTIIVTGLNEYPFIPENFLFIPTDFLSSWRLRIELEFHVQRNIAVKGNDISNFESSDFSQTFHDDKRYFNLTVNIKNLFSTSSVIFFRFYDYVIKKLDKFLSIFAFRITETSFCITKSFAMIETKFLLCFGFLIICQFSLFHLFYIPNNW